MKTWQTTYGTVLGTLAFIRTNRAPDGRPFSDDKPLYSRRLSPGALLAIRRFVRVLDETAADFRSAQEVIVGEEGSRDVDGALTEEAVIRLNALLSEPVTLEVSPIPASILMEDGGQVSAFDMEVLDPILDLDG